MAVVSAAILVLPLAVAFLPLIANLAGYFTVGLTADVAALRVIATAGTIGGVGLVSGIWLAVSSGEKRTG